MNGDNTDRGLRAFVSDGRLVRLPAPWARRRTVLEHVVQSFEPGQRFVEKEVDAVLRAWCTSGATDYVTLRRHLVDEGLLSRERGLYWRSWQRLSRVALPRTGNARLTYARRGRTSYAAIGHPSSR